MRVLDEDIAELQHLGTSCQTRILNKDSGNCSYFECLTKGNFAPTEFAGIPQRVRFSGQRCRIQHFDTAI